MQICDKNRAIIRAALTALLGRENEDAFAIFVETGTGKFVQFAGSATQGLHLDLPSQTLDVVENQRAEKYFLQLGTRPVEYDVFDQPGGGVVGCQRSYQKDFGKDTEAATRVAFEVFERIYQFSPDFELIVTEN